MKLSRVTMCLAYDPEICKRVIEEFIDSNVVKRKQAKKEMQDGN